MIPILHTERLTLRGHRTSDLADCAAMWGDANVTRYIGGRTFTTEEVWARLLRYIGHWSLMGFGYWAVCDRASGRFVGEVGFADFRRDVTPSFDGAAEIGWVLTTDSAGRGLATEAVNAVLAWGMAHRPTKRSVCLIESDNRASIAVAGKCGYVQFARTNYRGSDVLLFEQSLSPTQSSESPLNDT